MERFLRRTGIALLLVLCFNPFTLFSQVIKGDLSIGDTTKVHQIITKRGDVFLGRITQIENTEVRFLLNNTVELTFQLGDLEEISVVDRYASSQKKEDFKQGGPEGVNAQHGFFLPTGFLLPAGEHEFRNVGLFYNGLDFGLTDNLNIGFGGIPLIFANLIQGRLRVGFPIGDLFHLSLNGNVYGTFGAWDISGALSATGALTYGSAERNLTAGAGYGFGFGIEPGDGAVIANLGGAYRLNDKWRLVGEMILPVAQTDVLFLFTGGANRFWGRNRLEFGLGFVWGEVGYFPFPFWAYGYRFSRN